MAQVTLILVKRTQQRIALQMAALAALQHLRHALLQRVAAANNIGHPRLLLLRQRGRRQLGQRVLQRLLRRQQPFRFAFVLQSPHHLRQAHRRRGDIRRVPRQIHTAAHVVESLALHLLLQLAGVVKAEHRHAADQQGDHAHQQIKESRRPRALVKNGCRRAVITTPVKDWSADKRDGAENDAA